MRNLFPGSIMADEFAVNIQLTNAPGDEQAILGAEVNDNDGFLLASKFGLGGNRLLTGDFLGYFKISGYLDIPTGRYTVGISR